MTARLPRPPFDADERTQLMGWYDLQRSLVRWKCAGLAEADAHRAPLPTSPLMTVAGLVSHLRWTEHCWFEVMFLGRDPATNPQFDDETEDLDWQAGDTSLTELLDRYDAQCAAANAVIAAHPLAELGHGRSYGDTAPSLRWMIIHMVEETARHLGHLDLLREQLDGGKGYY